MQVLGAEKLAIVEVSAVAVEDDTGHHPHARTGFGHSYFVWCPVVNGTLTHSGDGRLARFLVIRVHQSAWEGAR
jgi:hypothetical protein